ncbi:MAG: TRAP transporter substrate-binding protein DctP [Gammaproteobacteria bacterium]|nr:TRAP transporter substrate-binding protein DctP [Gammaproteobacteria bacterium]MDH3429998.1 TRAP transporter substrate-binding protein DctP [Gammaproteobacteria bacterium]MDH3433563.1 TRAP transporter substrate-binding protein DctP [Gammaproteobacteria bacterium]
MKKFALIVSLLAFSGLTNATVLKIATVAPEGSVWMEEMRAGAKEIKERTEGRVQIKYYGGGVMGNDAKVLGKIRIGNLHGGAFTPSALQKIYPEISLYGLPLTFDSEDEAAFVREHLDQTIKSGLEDKGFINFGFAATGFAVIMSNEPVRGLDDMKGKRIWVPEGDTISYASMEALSLSPVTLPLTDVLTGLQTGLIDIVAISPIGALVLQWHTKVKYVTDMPLVYTMGFMAVAEKSFNKLSAEDQAIVRDVMTATYSKFDKKNLVDNKAAMEALLNAGIERVVPDAEEIAHIRDVLSRSNRSMAENGEYSLELYDVMMQYVQDFRNGSVGVAGN